MGHTGYSTKENVNNAVKVEGTKEWMRSNKIKYPEVDAYEAGRRRKYSKARKFLWKGKIKRVNRSLEEKSI